MAIQNAHAARRKATLAADAKVASTATEMRLEPEESAVILKRIGEPGWDRTIDTLIKSQVLYH